MTTTPDPTVAACVLARVKPATTAATTTTAMRTARTVRARYRRTGSLPGCRAGRSSSTGSPSVSLTLRTRPHPPSNQLRMLRWGWRTARAGRLAAEAYGVQILFAHLVDAREQVVEIVVLGVQVAARKRVVAPGCERRDEPGSQLRRRPGRTIGRP